jgi:HK97 family phage major capsid protein
MFGTVMGLPLRMKGIARALCLHAMMTSKSMTIPTVANEPTVAITSEEGTFSDAWGSTPFGQGTMTAKKIGSLVTISEELIADSTPDVVGEVCVRRIASALIKKEDQQLLEGDGTGANFTGLFAAAGVNSVAGGGAQINLDKFLDALTVLPQDALEDESITIVMHHKLWFSLLKLKVAQYSTDTNGDYRLAGPGTEPTNMSIGGFPVRWCDQILTNRGAGTNETTAYAGSFKSAVYGDRQLMTLSVDPYTKLDTGQLRLRVMERIGLLIAVPADFVKITAIIP